MKFGMDKEFDEWLQKDSLKSRTFEIGTKVRVRDSGSRYSCTKDGSEGFISRKSPIHNRVFVDFYKLTGTQVTPTIWSINKEHLEII